MRSNMVGKSVLSVNATYLLLLQSAIRFFGSRLSATSLSYLFHMYSRNQHRRGVQLRRHRRNHASYYRWADLTLNLHGERNVGNIRLAPPAILILQRNKIRRGGGQLHHHCNHTLRNRNDILLAIPTIVNES